MRTISPCSFLEHQGPFSTSEETDFQRGLSSPLFYEDSYCWLIQDDVASDLLSYRRKGALKGGGLYRCGVRTDIVSGATELQMSALMKPPTVRLVSSPSFPLSLLSSHPSFSSFLSFFSFLFPSIFRPLQVVLEVYKGCHRVHLVNSLQACMCLGLTPSTRTRNLDARFSSYLHTLPFEGPLMVSNSEVQECAGHEGPANKARWKEH